MFKNDLKRLLRRCGFELKRYRPESSSEACLQSMLIARHVDLIFDVGANTGQYSALLRDIGYKGRIVSFEPLPAAWEQLQKNSVRDSLWEVAPRTAIGGEDGSTEIHVSSNSVSSSILGMLNTHVDASPSSAYVGTVHTPLRRLDSIGTSYVRPDSVIFIKIDTQGFESQVLDGATELLSRATGVQLELSLVQLYEGQSLYGELIERLRNIDLQLWTMSPAFVDLKSGRLLQIDATFFRARP